MLCNPLCFLISKFGKSSVKTLKSALVDFYSEPDICSAKERLLFDIAKLDLFDKSLHVPTRRTGDDKLYREVDDILTLVTWLDEKLQFSNLPKYVSDNPDSMPSTRLYDGDLRAIMEQLGRMQANMATYTSTLAGVAAEVRAIKDQQSKFPSYSSVACNSLAQSTPGRSVRDSANSQQPTTTNSTFMSGISSIGSLSDVNAGLNTVMFTSAGSRPGSTAIDDQDPVRNWAAESAVPSSNRFSVLSDDDQSHGDRSRSGSASDFQRPKSETRKRLRQQARELRQRQQNETVPSSEAQQQTSSGNVTTARQRRGPLMIGKSSTSGSSSVTAAYKWYRKSVFYIDNVDKQVTVDTMSEFIRDELSVRLVSCHKVQPRRRRSGMQNNDTDTDADEAKNGKKEEPYKAFRVCINSDDRQLLLNEDKWPAYVAICDWFFKPQNNQSTAKKQRVESTPAAAAGKSTGHQPNDSHTDMDTTILAGTLEYIAANNTTN